MTVAPTLPRDYLSPRHPVIRPPAVASYAPAFSSRFESIYGPAAIVTLSEAAQARLRAELLP